MTYISPDGEEGYPGNLTATTTFILDNNDIFSIEYEAETDKKTIINSTHYGYFNLSAMKENIHDHELAIYGDLYTPVDEASIPTSEIKTVHHTPFDTKARRIGEKINQVNGGYTLNYVIAKESDLGGMRKHAELYHAASGRFLEVHSDAPGIQFYSCNFLDGVNVTDGVIYDKHMGLCLEPQFFPDSPNNAQFHFAILAPGDTFTRKIEFHLKIK